MPSRFVSITRWPWFAWTVSVTLAAGVSTVHADPPVAPSHVAAVRPEGAAVLRGHQIFGVYCVVCHGAEADGNGRAAVLYSPRPPNLRVSDKNDAYLGLIVQRGGAALGRSAAMPAWEHELSHAQIADLVAYLRSINTPVNSPPLRGASP